MTYSEDLINTTQIGDSTYLDDRPSYPSIFGIDLSPMLLGAVLAVAGIGGAGYLVYANVMPLYQANQEQQTKVANVQQQIQDRKDMAKKITEAEEKLKKVDAQREVVLSLFANEKKLDTLLIDINKLIGERQGQLHSFKPDPALTGAITDSSLGTALNGKLKRKTIDVEFRGGFEQMQSILSTVERMDQLLILQGFKTEISAENVSANQIAQVGPPNLKTTFKLLAIIPVAESKLAPASPAATVSPASTDKGTNKGNAPAEAPKKAEATKS
jgi:type IV pilus assembly protein PilO